VRAHRVEALVGQPGDPAELAGLPGVSDVVVEGRLASCTAHGDVGALVAMLSAWDVVELDSRELSLEEVFLSEFAAEPRG